MAGTFVLTNHGLFSISGADLKTKVDAISTFGTIGVLSGAGLHFVPVANGQQVWLLQVGAS